MSLLAYGPGLRRGDDTKSKSVEYGRGYLGPGMSLISLLSRLRRCDDTQGQRQWSMATDIRTGHVINLSGLLRCDDTQG